jgi:hypothetical protein
MQVANHQDNAEQAVDRLRYFRSECTARSNSPHVPGDLPRGEQHVESNTVGVRSVLPYIEARGCSLAQPVKVRAGLGAGVGIWVRFGFGFRLGCGATVGTCLIVQAACGGAIPIPITFAHPDCRTEHRTCNPAVQQGGRLPSNASGVAGCAAAPLCCNCDGFTCFRE